MTEQTKKILLEKLERNPGGSIEFDCELKDIEYGDYVSYTIENFKIYLFDNFAYILKNDTEWFCADISSYEYIEHSFDSWEEFETLVKEIEDFEVGSYELNELNEYNKPMHFYLSNYNNFIKDINDKKYSIEEQLDELFNKHYSEPVDKNILMPIEFSYGYYTLYSEENDNHLEKLYISKYNSIDIHNEETLIETKLFNGADIYNITEFDIYKLYRKIKWYNIIYTEWLEGENIRNNYCKLELEDISKKPHFKVGNITIVYGKKYIYYILLDENNNECIRRFLYEEYGKKKPFMEFKEEIIDLFETHMI